LLASPSFALGSGGNNQVVVPSRGKLNQLLRVTDFVARIAHRATQPSCLLPILFQQLAVGGDCRLVEPNLHYIQLNLGRQHCDQLLEHIVTGRCAIVRQQHAPHTDSCRPQIGRALRPSLRSARNATAAAQIER
jgi:hypothetical protein